jgi:DNA-binding MarR family transcriptional regulator
MLVEIAQMATVQKVPQQATSALRESELRKSIVAALLDVGRMRMRDLAERLQKFPQNLALPVRELVNAGLVDRQELGRTVFLSATPLAAAALEEIGGNRTVKAATAVPERTGTRLPAPATADPRALVLALCERVRSAPKAAQFREAEAAAAEFARATAARRFTRLPQRVSENQERHILLTKLADCESYLLRDADLYLFGEDAASYMPGVLMELQQGIALNVMRHLEMTERIIAARMMPGGTSVQLLGLVTDRVRANSMETANFI